MVVSLASIIQRGTVIKYLCNVVGTMFHEVAHVAGVPRSKLSVHNDPNNAERLKDAVHKLRDDSEATCFRVRL